MKRSQAKVFDYAGEADEIVRILAGAHLYGTQTPRSDTDIKAVFHATAAAPETVETGPAKNEGERNRPGDVDFTAFRLDRFLDMAADGNCHAVETLFAPESAWRAEPAPFWHEIIARRSRLISRHGSDLVGFSRKAAKLYGATPERIAEADQVAAWLEAIAERHGRVKLRDIRPELETMLTAGGFRHVAVQERPADPCRRRPPETLLVCCGRRVLIDETVRRAAKQCRDQYRAMVTLLLGPTRRDWRGMSHALRIGRQTIELLTTGALHFPRPDAAELLAIKTGNGDLPRIVEEIADLPDRILAAEDFSPLPAIVADDDRRELLQGQAPAIAPQS